MVKLVVPSFIDLPPDIEATLFLTHFERRALSRRRTYGAQEQI
jgi:hypothetical protein